MSMRKIRKSDEVIVLAGKDKGKQGTVLSVVDDEKVIVENVNMVKKHTKANPNKGEPGGIRDKEMPLHISNVGTYNPTAGSAARVRLKTLEDGRKVRYFKSNGEIVDV